MQTQRRKKGSLAEFGGGGGKRAEVDPISDIPPSLYARENKVSSSSSILSFPNPRRFIILSPPQHSRTEKKRKGLCSSLYLGRGDPTFGFPFIFYRFLPFFRSVCPPPSHPDRGEAKKRECCTAGHGGGGGGGGGTKQEFPPPLPHPSSTLCFPTSPDPRVFLRIFAVSSSRE